MMDIDDTISAEVHEGTAQVNEGTAEVHEGTAEMILSLDLLRHPWSRSLKS
ncbi:hypothetical protein Tco_0342351, partial [Tanacetum coccineum]